MIDPRAAEGQSTREQGVGGSARFTPEPWRLETDEDYPGEFVLLNADEVVCELNYFGRRSTALANARLIRAAPELYSFVQALSERLAHTCASAENAEYILLCLIEEFRPRGQSLLAKVRGES